MFKRLLLAAALLFSVPVFAQQGGFVGIGGSSTLISKTTVTGTPASVNIAIPGGYNYYKLVLRATNTGNAATLYGIQFNSDTTASDYYISYQTIGYSSNTPTTSAGFSSSIGVAIAPNCDDITLFPLSGGGMAVTINGSGDTAGIAFFEGAGQWNSGSVATTLNIQTYPASTLVNGGVFMLYGIN